MRVLIVEDGYEYQETLARFLADQFDFERSGNGREALTRLDQGGIDAVYLDMRFDRIPDHELLGDMSAVADAFNGDPVQAKNYLQDHQGTYILAAIREAGHSVPVLISFDFGGEPRRFARLRAAHSPVAYLADSAGPEQIATAIRDLSRG